MVRQLIKSAEVAAKLGRFRLDGQPNVFWFYKHRKRLERNEGFPGPVPGMGYRWDEAAIDAWLDRHLPEGRTCAHVVSDRGVADPGETDWDAIAAARIPAIIAGV